MLHQSLLPIDFTSKYFHNSQRFNTPLYCLTVCVIKHIVLRQHYRNDMQLIGGADGGQMCRQSRPFSPLLGPCSPNASFANNYPFRANNSFKLSIIRLSFFTQRVGAQGKTLRSQRASYQQSSDCQNRQRRGSPGGGKTDQQK